MSKANRKTASAAIYEQLADVRISDLERQRAGYALRDAEAIVDAVIRVKGEMASLGALLLRPGFKH